MSVTAGDVALPWCKYRSLYTIVGHSRSQALHDHFAHALLACILDISEPCCQVSRELGCSSFENVGCSAGERVGRSRWWRWVEMVP